MKGFRGSSYLKYQEDRLKQFLNNNTGMKVLIIIIRQELVVILNYLNVFRRKKPALILTTKITNVSNIVCNALFLKSMRKTILNE